MKFGYINMWAGFNCRVDSISIFEKYLKSVFGNLERVDPLNEESDIVISSVFNAKRPIGNPIVIKYSGEPYLHNKRNTIWWNFLRSDYTISFFPNSKKNLYFPIYLLYEDVLDNIINREKINNPYDRNFCSSVISHTSFYTRKRERLNKIVNTYKNVDFGGKWMNNVGGPVEDKIDFIRKYRFNLCSENRNIDGYITEKIFEAYAANTVPIYFGGGKLLDKYINTEAIIDCNNLTKSEIINAVKKVDQDKELYMHKYNNPLLINNELFEDFYKKLELFFKKIANNMG